MFEQEIKKEENLLIFKEIESQPAVTQRDLSAKLGISLGKTNYLLKELIKKGFIEIKNFSSGDKKLKKIHYLLTRKGFEHKVLLMQHFLQLKEAEYNQIKKEWEKITSGTDSALRGDV